MRNFHVADMQIAGRKKAGCPAFSVWNLRNAALWNLRDAPIIFRNHALIFSDAL